MPSCSSTSRTTHDYLTAGFDSNVSDPTLPRDLNHGTQFAGLGVMSVAKRISTRKQFCFWALEPLGSDECGYAKIVLTK